MPKGRARNLSRRSSSAETAAQSVGVEAVADAVEVTAVGAAEATEATEDAEDAEEGGVLMR
jgi:hypothetical protein